jgi:hypothetical protein
MAYSKRGMGRVVGFTREWAPARDLGSNQQDFRLAASRVCWFIKLMVSKKLMINARLICLSRRLTTTNYHDPYILPVVATTPSICETAS